MVLFFFPPLLPPQIMLYGKYGIGGELNCVTRGWRRRARLAVSGGVGTHQRQGVTEQLLPPPSPGGGCAGEEARARAAT